MSSKPVRKNSISTSTRSPTIKKTKSSISNSEKSSISNSEASSTSNIHVVVRVRPFTPKEIKSGEQSIVQMNEDGKETCLIHPTSKQKQIFTYDRSYWSFNPNSSHFASQETVYNELGNIVLNNAWKGYNASLFAYGQTGSGKTFSTFGSSTDYGIIPRLCHDLFKMIDENKKEGTTFTVEASMLEIYSERVKDLLDPTNPQNEIGLKVRESQQTGPYVEGLCINYCSNAKDLLELLDQGQKYKTIASTSMNDTSSRAHTIFQIYLTQTSKVGKKNARKRSIISLIDLAGSERQSKAQTTGQRLKEGAAINLSLTMLGNVIKTLAEGKEEYVPYRNSILTFLLKESLGGNAKTIMISTISPAASNYEESLSTLQYANRAKSIKNKARINEDSTSRIINALKEEIEKLKNQLNERSQHSQENELLRLQLLESQKMLDQFGMSDQEKELLAKVQKEKRNAFLQKSGLIIADRKEIPHFVNLSEDISMNECLLFFFKKNFETSIGSDQNINEIVLNDPKILSSHCIVKNENNDRIVIIPNNNDAIIYVNGKRIYSETELNSSDRVLIGAHQIFRFSNPTHPATDNRIIDIDMAREELEKKLELEFAQKREEKIQELESLNDKKQSELDMINKLTQLRQNLLNEIQNSQKQQLEVVNRTLYDTEDIMRLKDDVDIFQKKLLEEQERKKLIEEESRRKANELLDLNNKISLVTQNLQKEQAQRHKIEIEMKKLQDHIKIKSDEMNEMSRSLMVAKQEKEKLEKQSQEINIEYSQLLPELQNMMLEAERNHRIRTEELSRNYSQKVAENEELKRAYQKLKSEKLQHQDEFLANILHENDTLKLKIQQLQSHRSDSSEEQQLLIRSLQSEISTFRKERDEFEQKINGLEYKLKQKETIIRALQGEFD